MSKGSHLMFKVLLCLLLLLCPSAMSTRTGRLPLVDLGDGASYEGDWLNDKAQGSGIFTWANGARYEGDFSDGLPQGHGILTWADGTRYEGDFRDGKHLGPGIYTWPDGSRYDGDWMISTHTLP